jgi:hypothetical protein
MTRSTVQHTRVNIGSCASRETLEEIGNKFRVQIANRAGLYFGSYDGGRTSTKIDGHHAQSFIHRHHEIAGAKDSSLRSQRALESMAQADTHILHSVVLVNMQIALGLQIEIETSMPR